MLFPARLQRGGSEDPGASPAPWWRLPGGRQVPSPTVPWRGREGRRWDPLPAGPGLSQLQWGVLGTGKREDAAGGRGRETRARSRRSLPIPPPSEAQGPPRATQCLRLRSKKPSPFAQQGLEWGGCCGFQAFPGWGLPLPPPLPCVSQAADVRLWRTGTPPSFLARVRRGCWVAKGRDQRHMLMPQARAWTSTPQRQ